MFHELVIIEYDQQLKCFKLTTNDSSMPIIQAAQQVITAGEMQIAHIGNQAYCIQYEELGQNQAHTINTRAIKLIGIELQVTGVQHEISTAIAHTLSIHYHAVNVRWKLLLYHLHNIPVIGDTLQ